MTRRLVKRRLNTCPLCGWKGLSIVAQKEYVLAHLAKRIDQSYRVCRRCEFVFTQDPLTDASLARYYASNTQERRAHADDNEQRHIASQLEFLTGAVHLAHGRMLEIGANNGTFLEAAAAYGFAELFYSELNADSRTILEAKTHLRDVGALPAQSRRRAFDVIVLLHTLEHIVKPVHFVKRLKRYLRDGGSVFVEVPDFTLHDSDTDDLLFEHVNFFTEDTLRRLFVACGLTVVSSRVSIDRNYPACPKYVCQMIARSSSLVPAGHRQRARAFARHEAREAASFRRLDKFLRTIPRDRPLGIYSASWLTAECLRQTALASHNIVGIFDRDARKWGTKMTDIAVLAPRDVLVNAMDAMLILNEGYEAEIRADLRSLGFPETTMIKGWSEFQAAQS